MVLCSFGGELYCLVGSLGVLEIWVNLVFWLLIEWVVVLDGGVDWVL